MTHHKSFRNIIVRTALLIFFFVVLHIPYSIFQIPNAYAARLYFNEVPLEVSRGEIFEARLILDTEDELINALEGTIVFSDTLRVREIHTGSSLLTLWIVEPTIEENTILFSGIIPGGFKGELSPYWKGYRPGEIMRVFFEPVREGSATLSLHDNTVVLRHDGSGSVAELTTEEAYLDILSKTDTPQSKVSFPLDTGEPELFEPKIISDPSIADGAFAVVFQAQDKASGIDYYEICEHMKEFAHEQLCAQKWKKAESPYILTDQRLQSFIYVKAVDRSGNIRIAVTPPQKPTSVYEQYRMLGILSIVLLLIIFFLKKRKLV